MKPIFFLIAVFFATANFAQTTGNANVYPSNLEENMYFSNFDAATNTIEGLHFMVLADGDNSRYVTPPFEVSIYLMPEGSSSAGDMIIVKRYPLDGIYHMGKHEFKNETIHLNETTNIGPGNYRLGIWVNSDEAFAEDRNDNATLFRTSLQIVNPTTGLAPETEKDDDWDDWDDEDDDW